MDKNYELELPEGYREAYVMDAKEKKTVILMNAACLVMTAVGIVAALFIFRPNFDGSFIVPYFIALAVMLVYLVLHELTHGAAYKITTGRKLTFGLTLSVAYCGVPDIFVYRKAALISLLAPFTVFDIVFLLGALLWPSEIGRFLSAALLAVHIGGCVGDLYDTYLFLTRFRDPSVLMKDTGPKQTFYTK